jgi:hypothetical protein
MTHAKAWRIVLAIGAICTALSARSAIAADDKGSPIVNRSIAYVLTNRDWGIYQTGDTKAECPDGLSEWGPREQFKSLFMEDGKKRTLEETQLARESAIWFPRLGPDQFPFKQAAGKIAYGLNLDGKVKPTDFTNPTGEKGIDNQLFRAIGCNDIFRGPSGIVYLISNQLLRRLTYNRVLIELTDVDSLTDDDDVTVTIYRGRDGLILDATGKNVIPGGTQRIDYRWGKSFIQRLHGKISGGVLTTDPADMHLPYAIQVESQESYLGARLQLKLTPQKAEGVLGGYVGVDSWYHQFQRTWATVYQSYGRTASQSLYKQLRALADGYPDPKTGENTAISAASRMFFSQVYIQRDDKEKRVAASADASARKAAEASR